MIPKLKSEPLGVVIVESGWGSMVPTVVLANLQPGGAAARCGQLNIGDQIMTVNGVSLVGLALSTCQNYIRVCQCAFVDVSLSCGISQKIFWCEVSLRKVLNLPKMLKFCQRLSPPPSKTNPIRFLCHSLSTYFLYTWGSFAAGSSMVKHKFFPC